MGGCRCSYRNCTNTTKTRDNLHFFHYPVKQKERCRQWIENAKKPQFYDLDEDQLRNKVVCETHFEICYFPNEQKKRLLQGAIPTLNGDCKTKLSPNGETLKIQDVQVLPANADGTIFILETQNNYISEKVESYIYTNNGLMVPLNKSNESNLDTALNSSLYTGNDNEEMETTPHKPIVVDIKDITDFDVFVHEFDSVQGDQNKHKVIKPPRFIENKKPSDESRNVEDLFVKTINMKYIKQIKQHSKDIALLKRMLKSKQRQSRRLNNTAIINILRKQLPPSLLNVVKLNILNSTELTAEDAEFFSTIYSTSPQVYHLLAQKYQWQLPPAKVFNSSINKNNGHVFCEDD